MFLLQPGKCFSNVQELRFAWLTVADWTKRDTVATATCVSIHSQKKEALEY